MFDSFGANGVHVDVLVLNAALIVDGALSDQGWEKTWEQFVVNTRALHQLYDRLHKQEQGKRKISGQLFPLTLFLTSSPCLANY
jgi:short-subunit dehydrogenase